MPGIERSIGRTTQSCTVRRSVSSSTLSARCVLVDLAERGRHRTEHRHDALRQPRRDLEQPLHDELAREEHVGLLGEDQRDQRQARPVERAQLDQARQAGHPDLQRHGREALDLFGRAARRFGRDLDLDVGDVRERVQRELPRGVEPEREQDGRDDRDDQALRERPPDERLDQEPSVCARRRSLFR
jgi:hypothetical protein